MSGIANKLRNEFIRLIPALLFFLVAFNLLVLIEDLATEEYGIKVFHFASATVAALLIGKVILLVDFLPVADMHRNKPLIYQTLWKTAIYLIAALVFLYVEHMIPLLLKHHGFIEASRHLFDSVTWPRFLAILIWLATLFFIFTAAQELITAIGKDHVRRLFFGR